MTNLSYIIHREYEDEFYKTHHIRFLGYQIFGTLSAYIYIHFCDHMIPYAILCFYTWLC
jgi:hypothetical protein